MFLLLKYNVSLCASSTLSACDKCSLSAHASLLACDGFEHACFSFSLCDTALCLCHSAAYSDQLHLSKLLSAGSSAHNSAHSVFAAIFSAGPTSAAVCYSHAGSDLPISFWFQVSIPKIMALSLHTAIRLCGILWGVGFRMRILTSLFFFLKMPMRHKLLSRYCTSSVSRRGELLHYSGKGAEVLFSLSLDVEIYSKNVWSNFICSIQCCYRKAKFCNDFYFHPVLSRP